MPEALNFIALSSGRTPLYSHNAAVIFGRACAERGIADPLDFFIRHYDARPTAKVFLAQDTAEGVLTQADLTAERFAQLSGGAKYSGLSVDVNVLQLVNWLYGVNKTAVLPALSADDMPEPVGTAILKSDRLCAVLTPEETQGLCVLQGGLAGGEFAVRDKTFGTVSLKIRCADSKIRFDGTEETYKFTADIQIEAEVSSVSKAEHRVGKDAFPRFEAALSDCVRACVSEYLETASGCEAAGLREVLYRDAPQILKSAGENISEKLAGAEINLNITSRVQRVEEEDIPYL